MESLVVVSKTKKYIKDRAGLNTSSTFFPEISKKLEESIREAIDNANKAKRKTLMGRDFPGFDEDQPEDEVLVVASKIKKLVKDQAGLNTSSQVLPALTFRVHQACGRAIDSAKLHGRKTVMDRDLVE